MAYSRRRIDTLVSMNVDYIVKNLGNYLTWEFETLKLLPPKIKNRMLQKFMSSSYFWANINFNKALSALIHPMMKRIDLSLATVDDEVLDTLKSCYNLRDVYLTRQVDVDGKLSSQALINFLSPLKNLFILEVANCKGVNDDVLITISENCPKLAGLDIYGCTGVSDVGLEEIAKLENLQWITLSSTEITNRGLRKLAIGTSGSKIKELRVANCKHVNCDILQVITDHCKNIEILEFYNLANENCALQEGSLKNLKLFTWTIQW